ncbi:MAG: hypothetical protein PHT91_01745 [Candidatus Nanoarchaeia archaeon]|nr:hypothetical protein [Candidatus Nanoarchaeia archaeon]MDD5054614.1 hypothetical protein [Candidatus Nanoarchaeia archaeon]MDD5499578.1 hypothetical protein [Candidatus Nanoarchaeia archaeon]
MIKLEMSLCKGCGDCCLDICKSADGICHETRKTPACYAFPIIKTGTEYSINMCKGIIRNESAISILEKIILRLNKGEKDFEIRSQGIYFSCN